MNIKYNKDYHDDWAWSLAIKGATDQEIADAMGITRRTVMRWSRAHDKNGKPVRDEEGNEILTSFGESLAAGKAVADAKVERKLYERCMGYMVEEEEHVTDAKKVRVTKKKKHVAPDTMAIMYWLNNRKRKSGEWSQRQDVNVSIGDDSIRDAVRELTIEEAREKLKAIRSSENGEE